MSKTIQLIILIMLVLSISSMFSVNSVKNLTCYDVPFDDASGLELSWDPLPKEDRIIEYRIYRGLSPDSLFLLGRIQVNPKTGVAAKKLTFKDANFLNFVSIDSPAKMKKEKGPHSGNIYKYIPRDLDVYGPMMDKFYVLGELKKDEFYYKTKRILRKNEDTVESFSGMKLHQFEGLYASLIPEVEYFYTVIAVDFRGRYSAPANIVSSIPTDNPPETPDKFYVIADNSINTLKFEWEMPNFNDDIYYHSIYALPKDSIKDFNKYQANKTELINPAKLIFRTTTAFPYDSSPFVELKVENNRIVNEEYEINESIDFEKIDEYYFFLSYLDYIDQEVFSKASEVEIIEAKNRPVLPEFQVYDEENDKGDYNEIRFSKPIVYLTKVYVDWQKSDKLKINYDLITNDNYKINKIYLDLFDKQGNKIASHTEHYLDNTIKIKVKNNVNLKEGLVAELSLKTSKTEISEKYKVSQDLFYDPQLQQITPDLVKIGGETLTNYSYTILKRNKYDENFRKAKKISAMSRDYDDNIAYEEAVYKRVEFFDKDKNLILVTPSLPVRYDQEPEKRQISTYVFMEDVNKEIVDMKLAITEIEELITNESSKEKVDSLQFDLTSYQKELDILENDPLIGTENGWSSNKSRMKKIAKAREKGKRSFCYIMVKSDGKANFVMSEIYTKDNQKFFYPTSDWFDKDKVPMLVATLIFGLLVFIFVRKALAGHDLYVRPIAGLEEIDNAIGRATEMGKPMLFVPGLSSIGDVATLAGLSILGHVAKKAAEYDSKILTPVCDYIVLPIAQEVVKEAYWEAGRPDAYEKSDTFFVAEGQFAYVAGVNGVMIREKTATNFYMGMFFAESLILTETGNATGAIQIAGTDALTQIPFFITTCDYTLIGEELYGASAYLSRDPLMIGTLKAQDYAKLFILIFVVLGTFLSTINLNFLINSFPDQ